jgi:hypothetical protein
MILFIIILNSSLLVTLYVKSAKGIMFHKWKSYLFKSEPRLQIACGIRELHAKPIMFSIPLGELKFE